MTFLTPWPRSD